MQNFVGLAMKTNPPHLGKGSWVASCGLIGASRAPRTVLQRRWQRKWQWKLGWAIGYLFFISVGQLFRPRASKILKNAKQKRTQKTRERAGGKKLRRSSFLQRRPGASREPSQKAASRDFGIEIFAIEEDPLGSRSKTCFAPSLDAKFEIIIKHHAMRFLGQNQF